MNLFIMYMAGNSISIFPIMMVGMLIIRPVKALFTLQQSKFIIVKWVDLTYDKLFDNMTHLFFFIQHLKWLKERMHLDKSSCTS